jgi:hypothetical protein
MNSIQIRRVKMDDSENRADVMWVLFRAGEIRNPLAILHEFELRDLVESIDRQTEGR